MDIDCIPKHFLSKFDEAKAKSQVARAHNSLRSSSATYITVASKYQNRITLIIIARNLVAILHSKSTKHYLFVMTGAVGTQKRDVTAS